MRCGLLGHLWSEWWMGSDGRWYRMCDRSCGIRFQSRVDD